jgi:hypothetical protein
LFGLLVAASSCDFDAAFRQYCKDTHNCTDAASPPDTADTASPLDRADAASPPDTADAASPPDTADAASPPDLESPPEDTAPPFWMPKSCGPGIGECGSDELCNSMNQICMKKCNGDGDCPHELGLDRCEDVGMGGRERIRVCKCSGWVSCESAGNDLICNNVDRLCEPRCSVREDCNVFSQGRVCDAVSGECKRPCKENWECNDPDYPRCDWGTGLCKPCVESGDCYGRFDNRTECMSGSCV